MSMKYQIKIYLFNYVWYFILIGFQALSDELQNRWNGERYLYLCE